MWDGADQSRRLVLVLAVVLGVLAACDGSVDSPLALGGNVVQTSLGPVRGTSDGDIQVFRGIPFATPPVGELRWRPPVPPTPWDDPLDATTTANACVQTNTFGVFAPPSDTEDCLYLNVFTPGTEGERPVMVWIHGGGLFDGSAGEYDATRLARQGDVVVVTINYRLNVFGFLAHPAINSDSDSNTNYGLMDQQQALEWVQRNITAFGGDPGSVTIFGESAGGTAVLFNLVSPTADGLFHRAIVHSPAYGPVQARPADALERGVAFAAALGCGADTSPETAACLRSKSVDEIIDLAGEFVGQGPVRALDGRVLTLDMGEAFETGRFHRVPIIAGNNRDEQTWFIGMQELDGSPPVSPSDYPELVGGGTNASRILAEYPLEEGANPSEVLAALRTDAGFACGTRRGIRTIAQHVSVWAYEFADRTAPFYFPPVSFEYGAAHTVEIQYLFEGFHGASGVPQTLNAAQRRLSDAMIGYWTTFARTGDPNASGLPNWAPYNLEDDNYQFLELPEPGPSFDFSAIHKCAFWDSLEPENSRRIE